MVGFVIFYIVFAVLCAVMVAYNYTTKMYRKGEKVYSRGGFILRMLSSIVPVFNVFAFIAALVSPFGDFWTWLDAETNEPCRRAKLEAWLNGHSHFNKE